MIDFSSIFDDETPEEAKKAQEQAQLRAGVLRDKGLFPGKIRSVNLTYAGDDGAKMRNGELVEIIAARNERGGVNVVLDQDRVQGEDKGRSYKQMMFAVSRLHNHGGDVDISAEGQFKKRNWKDASGADRHSWEFRATKVSMTGLNEKDERQTYTVGFDKREMEREEPVAKKSATRSDEAR